MQNSTSAPWRFDVFAQALFYDKSLRPFKRVNLWTETKGGRHEPKDFFWSLFFCLPLRTIGFRFFGGLFIKISKMDFGQHEFIVVDMGVAASLISNSLSIALEGSVSFPLSLLQHPMYINLNTRPDGTRTGTEFYAFGYLASAMNFRIRSK